MTQNRRDKSKSPYFWAMIDPVLTLGEELIGEHLFKRLPEAIEYVKPYRGIVRLIDVDSKKVVWERK